MKNIFENAKFGDKFYTKFDMNKNYKNESEDSVIARYLLETIIYDNDIAVGKKSFHSYKSHLQRMIKALPDDIKYKLADEEFADVFCIGEETEIEEIVEQFPQLRPINDILNDFFDNADE